MSGEAAFIERLRAIATHPAARGLADDAALLDGLVLTHDMIAEGVHFLADDPPGSVGWKLAAVNLSDLAAKGAEPLAALMGATLSGDPAWDAAFLEGLAEACSAYNMALIGGDTIALPPGAPRLFGLTAIGRAGPLTPPRSGGRAGDRLWVVGAIGDAGAGLEVLRRDPNASGPLVEAYRRPVPLVEAGRLLAAEATAMMDVSDGLLLDAMRLAQASGCGATIDLAAIPLSPAFVAARGEDRAARLFAATAGDDYALLAGIRSDFDARVRLCLPSSAMVACIGTLDSAPGLRLRDKSDEVPLPERLGYEHFPPPDPSPMGDRDGWRG